MPRVIFLIIICSLGFSNSATTQSYPYLRLLFDSSDVVILGTIVRDECITEEAGVLSCTYSINVDSILKGSIPKDTYLDRVQRPGTKREKTNYISLYYNCFPSLPSHLESEDVICFNNNCLKRNQKYILFLRIVKIVDSNEIAHIQFKLLDEWIGAVPEHNYVLVNIYEWSKPKRNKK